MRKENNTKSSNKGTFLGLTLIAAAIVFVGLKWVQSQSDNADSIQPEILGIDVEALDSTTNINAEIIGAVSSAEAKFDLLTDENAGALAQFFKEESARLSELEDSELANAASAYVSMMYAVCQNRANQRIDAELYSAKEAEARVLLQADKEIFESLW